MKSRPLFRNPILWLAASGIATVVIVACSSSTTPSGSGDNVNCAKGDTVACECANGQSGTGICGSGTCSCDSTSSSSSGGSSSSGSSSGVQSDDAGHSGDGGHVDDGASPAALYSACAAQGGFGWTCTQGTVQTATLDPTECTDPNFPYCFLGGQGGWCTASCEDDAGGFAACLTAADAAAGDILAIDSDGGDAGGPGCTPTACNARGYCK